MTALERIERRDAAGEASVREKIARTVFDALSVFPALSGRLTAVQVQHAADAILAALPADGDGEVSTPSQEEREGLAEEQGLVRTKPAASPSPAVPSGSADSEAFSSLRAANVARQREWTAGQDVSLLFRANELAGEVGEACNVVKKLERERCGWAGSRATLDDLADELADIIICTDLTALSAGIDLWAAVCRKFNATSDKVGLRTRLRSGT